MASHQQSNFIADYSNIVSFLCCRSMYFSFLFSYESWLCQTKDEFLRWLFYFIYQTWRLKQLMCVCQLSLLILSCHKSCVLYFFSFIFFVCQVFFLEKLNELKLKAQRVLKYNVSVNHATQMAKTTALLKTAM
ncbi:hypothetical protein RYX36_003473 [Vicia faba]